jgi:hypothetical protein
MYASPNIIRIIRSRRIRWAQHIACMGEKRNAYRAEGKRPLGIHKQRWEDNIKMDFRKIGWSGMDWIDLAQDRDRCRTLVAMSLRVR